MCAYFQARDYRFSDTDDYNIGLTKMSLLQVCRPGTDFWSQKYRNNRRFAAEI